MSEEQKFAQSGFDLDLSETTMLVVKWLFRIGILGIILALSTVVINFGLVDATQTPFEWLYNTGNYGEPPVVYHVPGDPNTILPYYNPNILLIYGILVVASSTLIAFSTIAFYIRYRNPLAILTTIIFVSTIAFTLGWMGVLLELLVNGILIVTILMILAGATYVFYFLSKKRYALFITIIAIVITYVTLFWTGVSLTPIEATFVSYNVATNFFNDVGWAVTSYMIGFMFLGLTFFHVFSGPRRKLDLRTSIIGLYMIVATLFALMVPHLGFLWNTPDIRWIDASIVWLIQAQFVAIPGFWWVSKESRTDNDF